MPKKKSMFPTFITKKKSNLKLDEESQDRAMAAAESSDGNNNAAATTVTLISSDNTRFEVGKAAASLSGTVRRMMLEAAGRGDDDISLPNIDRVTLSKVLEYCMKHAPG